MSKEAKGKIKDSIFTNLFGQKRYMRELRGDFGMCEKECSEGVSFGS